MSLQSGIDRATGNDITKMGLVELRADSGDIRYLGEVQRLALAAEDIIVIRSVEALSETRVIGIKAFIENQFTGHRCIVLDRGMEIGILSPQPVGESFGMKVQDGTL
jgi:hypothetical protein